MADKTKNDFLQLLIKKPNTDISVNSIHEYMDAIFAIKSLYLNILFRGQSKKDWHIESAAYRKLKKGAAEPSLDELYNYHKNLISNIKHLNESECNQSSDMLTLAYAQHHGAKTNLLDFTFSPLVALWFSCSETEFYDDDGMVVWMSRKTLPIDDTYKIEDMFSPYNSSLEPYLFTPPILDRRIMAQHSVFIATPKGVIENFRINKIIIPSAAKKIILDQLSELGISQKTIYPDFSGFVKWYEYDGKERIDSLMSEAAQLNEKSKYKEALNLYLQCENIGKKPEVFGINDVREAKILDYIAGLYRELSDNEKVLEYRDLSLSIKEKIFGENHPETAISYSGLAILYREMDDYVEAIKYHEKTLAIRLKTLGNNDPETAITYNNLGFLYYRCGDYTKALDYYNKSLEVRMSLYGDLHRFVAVSYANLAEVYTELGRYEKAKIYGLKALNIREKTYGKEHATIATIYGTLGTLMKKSGDYSQAIKYIEKAISIQSEFRGSESSAMATYYNDLGEVYTSLKENDIACDYLKKALEIRIKVYGEENSQTAESYFSFAKYYDSLTAVTDSIEFSLKTYKIYKKVFGDSSPKTQEIFLFLKKCYEKSGKDDFDTWVSTQTKL